MGWYANAKRDIGEFYAMSPEEKCVLTFDEAAEFVPPDTLKLAAWSGLKNKGYLPADALRFLFSNAPANGLAADAFIPA